MDRIGRRASAGKETVWTGWPYLILLLVCFVAGALVGFCFAYFRDASEDLRIYLQDYLDLAARGEMKLSFFSVFWDCLRWPAAVIVLGFTAIGVLAIPALLLIRGFLLTYAATCFALLLGRGGLAAAATLLLIDVFLILPILLILGCEGLRTSFARLPGTSNSVERKYRLEVALPGAGISLVAAALQWTVIPMLFSLLCMRYFT